MKEPIGKLVSLLFLRPTSAVILEINLIYNIISSLQSFIFVWQNTLKLNCDSCNELYKKIIKPFYHFSYIFVIIKRFVSKFIIETDPT